MAVYLSLSSDVIRTGQPHLHLYPPPGSRPTTAVPQILLFKVLLSILNSPRSLLIVLKIISYYLLWGFQTIRLISLTYAPHLDTFKYSTCIVLVLEFVLIFSSIWILRTRNIFSSFKIHYLTSEFNYCYGHLLFYTNN